LSCLLYSNYSTLLSSTLLYSTPTLPYPCSTTIPSSVPGAVGLGLGGHVGLPRPAPTGERNQNSKRQDRPEAGATMKHRCFGMFHCKRPFFRLDRRIHVGRVMVTSMPCHAMPYHVIPCLCLCLCLALSCLLPCPCHFGPFFFTTTTTTITTSPSYPILSTFETSV